MPRFSASGRGLHAPWTDPIVRVAREATPFLLIALALVPLAAWLGGTTAAIVAILPAILVLFFFRDPPRAVPAGPGLVLAPADGRIVDLRTVDDETFPGGTARRVSIFLSIFNVHINRAPVCGEVSGVVYRRGRFRAAFHGKASEENERNRIDLATPEGPVAMTQIAGAIARRIVCDVSPGDRVRAGQRVGLIRFGSRVDLILPVHWHLDVSVGTRVRACRTVMARTAGKAARPGAAAGAEQEVAVAPS
ncbi:MAG: phosphatidylserine decarboxylase family protein [Acidobacteriota bacterium]